MYGRRLLIGRVTAGRPVAHVAAELGISRATGYKWQRRYATEGERPWAPRAAPHHTFGCSPAIRE